MARQQVGFWTLDAETDPFSLERNRNNEVPQPFVWGAYHSPSEDYHQFKTASDVAEFFKDQKTVVYAHNGGKFDYHYLREHINSDEPLLIIGGRLSKFKIGECEFRDSLNLFQGTRLDQLGAKSVIDYALFEPDKRSDPNNFNEICKYLKQDNVVLSQALGRYFSDYGKSLTQASAAMKYWQKNFNQVAPRQSYADFQRYKPYYTGGRVQCFESGFKQADFSVVDINSAYPYAMTFRHPISTHGVLRKDLPPVNQYHRCLIKLKCIAKGCFPWRDDEGALYFPEDERHVRVYHVTGWEYLTAIALDAIRKVTILEVHYFTETVTFKDYIDHFYAERQQCKGNGDVMGDIFAKYFMNSLYGKFGQDVDNHDEYVIASDDSRAQWLAKGFQSFKPWGDRFLLRRSKKLLSPDSEQRRYYNIATASSITGFVRAHLFKNLLACSRPLYCDTDSITAADTSAVPQSKVLGDFKLEMEGDHYAIAGKKMYALHMTPPWVTQAKQKDPDASEYKVACKGVDLTAEQIIQVAKGGKVLYESESPCYSITRNVPRYINREVRQTAKNIAKAPLQ